ncbi:MAG: L-rhamnose/proton symporter RhaT [Gammaproteobacteria bacterium]|jgi:L-rhamnose-H+ transport protein
MHIILALIFILVAGIINGSFALPTKHVTNWNFENIWLHYAVWAFILLPWITIFVLTPNVIQIYAATPWRYVLVMILGGVLFGAGQIGFAFAMSMIGIGITFVICIGLSIGLGFLLPLIIQHSDQVFTPFGILTIFGAVLAVIGLCVATYAGELHHRNKNTEEQQVEKFHMRKFYYFGVLLAITAGLFSAGQNFSFSLTSQMQQTALNMGASTLGASVIMWPGFLFFSFIPYAGYMLYLHYRNNSFQNYLRKNTGKYYLFSIIMGLCWFGSLIFYSRASQLIGSLGPVIGWPMFMVLVILTSNFIGWRHREWENCLPRIRNILWVGLSLLIVSVILLGDTSTLHIG